MKLILELRVWEDECETAQYHGFEGEKDEAAALIHENVEKLKTQTHLHSEKREKEVPFKGSGDIKKRVEWQRANPSPPYSFNFYGHQLHWRDFAPFADELRFKIFTLDEFFQKILP